MNNFCFSIKNVDNYPIFPYSPDKKYLELSSFVDTYDPENLIYGMMRDLFTQSNYDKNNIGKEFWNPFRGLIKNNQKVVIKPNT